MTISPDYHRRLVVMVKEPRPGRVKTRLGRDMGMTTAAWWYRHQTQSLLRRVQHRGWRTILAVSPDVEGMRSRIWPRNLDRWPQGRGDLGTRMRRIFEGMPPGPVLIVGSDIPGIARQHIQSAFTALGSNDAVFGPATDGGYWLVGFKRSRSTPPGLFSRVRWSTEHALSDSLAALGDRPVAMVEALKDVDTVADL